MALNKHIITIIALFALGCSSGEETNRELTYPVSGMVTLDDTPLAGATVTFRPTVKGGRGAVAITDETGSYQLMTYETADGAAAGDYIVSVVKQEHTPGDPSYTDSDSDNYGQDPPPGAEAKTVDLVPTKYANGKTSGLTATVEEGENLFPLELSN